MSFWFRVRFHLSARSRLGDDPEECVLTLANGDGEDVTLELGKQPEDNGLDGRRLVVFGKGYASKGDAAQAASDWRDAIIAALAGQQVGADFGHRKPMSGGLTPAFRAELSEVAGAEVRNDIHGIDVFEVPEPEKRPFFSGSSARGAKVVPLDAFTIGLADARARRAHFNDQQRLAFDLFSGSFFQPSADARFVMLAMALETLIELEPRPADAVAHVERMIAATESSALEENQRKSIIGSLGWLREESIGQGGRRLAKILGDRKYMNNKESAPQFFTGTYTMRSALVHGYYPRPTHGDVDARAANLEVFLADMFTILGERGATELEASGTDEPGQERA